MNKVIIKALFFGVFMVAAFALSSPPACAGSVPNPTVIGPIPVSVPLGDPSHDYPFFATNIDLTAYGYVEQEFFIEGTANRYNIPTPPPGKTCATLGVNCTGTILDSDHPYKTRMVVRRPISKNHFNGVVLLEWQNVTAGYDLDAMWVVSKEHFLRAGYAWVGVSAQQVGIHQPVTGLKAWSTIRYGTLDVTVGGTIVNDALCYDIYSQAAQAIKSPLGIDPMGGLPVKLVFAIGASQSASRLVTYYNSVLPIILPTDVLDGFIFSVGGAQSRNDLGFKRFKVLTETDIAILGQAAIRQPDSDSYRTWEVAGAAHFDYYSLEGLTPLVVRDGIPPTPTNCTYPPFSHIPFYYVGNASYDHLVRWVTDGTPPSTAPPIEVTSLGPPVVIARDSFGNALGGIRLSQHAVPTATNSGTNGGPAFCLLFGTYLPFDDTTLDALYRNHGDYVSQVNHVTNENLKTGYILIENAQETRVEAAHSTIP
jgi:hypothetical protein